MSKQGVKVKYTAGSFRVKIHNLLKYRDEYTRKSGQSPDSKLKTELKEETDLIQHNTACCVQPAEIRPSAESENENAGHLSSASEGAEGSGAKTANEPKSVGKLHGTVPVCPVEEIRALYNALLPELPTCNVMNAGRVNKVKNRWRETWIRLKGKEKAHDGEALIKWFGDYFRRVRDMPLLMGQELGRDGKTAFRADFAWLMTDENYAKVVEGRYLPMK
jgi:hypothetical protein